VLDVMSEMVDVRQLMVEMRMLDGRELITNLSMLIGVNGCKDLSSRMTLVDNKI